MALRSLRNCSTEVARLRRGAVAAGLRELRQVPELEIPRVRDLMLQIEDDLHRIRRKRLEASGNTLQRRKSSTPAAISSADTNRALLNSWAWMRRSGDQSSRLPHLLECPPETASAPQNPQKATCELTGSRHTRRGTLPRPVLPRGVR